MKKCNDCESLFGEHYLKCPSCGSSNFKNYKQSEEYIKEEKDDAMVLSMDAMAVNGDLDDMEL